MTSKIITQAYRPFPITSYFQNVLMHVIMAKFEFQNSSRFAVRFHSEHVEFHGFPITCDLESIPSQRGRPHPCNAWSSWKEHQLIHLTWEVGAPVAARLMYQSHIDDLSTKSMATYRTRLRSEMCSKARNTKVFHKAHKDGKEVAFTQQEDFVPVPISTYVWG